MSSEFESWLDAAWERHADEPAGVAARIVDEGLALANADAEVAALARLAHHVCGDHLGDVDGGRRMLARLATADACMQVGAEATRRSIARLDASLIVTGGGTVPEGHDPSERIQVLALAASNLCERDPRRAGALLAEAEDEARRAALVDDDPAVRALAIAGNNIAAALEERPDRSDAERALMLAAARAGRTYWGRAGTWLETERAEYRLAMSCLAAGDATQARTHAEACLAIVRANDAPALEWFFGWEALSRAARAAGDGSTLGMSLAEARAAFERLTPSDQGWCRASLDGIGAPVRSVA